MLLGNAKPKTLCIETLDEEQRVRHEEEEKDKLVKKARANKMLFSSELDKALAKKGLALAQKRAEDAKLASERLDRMQHHERTHEELAFQRKELARLHGRFDRLEAMVRLLARPSSPPLQPRAANPSGLAPVDAPSVEPNARHSKPDLAINPIASPRRVDAAHAEAKVHTEFFKTHTAAHELAYASPKLLAERRAERRTASLIRHAHEASPNDALAVEF